MTAPLNDKEHPDGPTTLELKLKRLCKAFKSGLELIRGYATANGSDPDVKAYTAEGTGVGAPRKHVIAAALACMDNELASLFGRVRWRCSMSINQETEVSKVREILNAIRPDAAHIQDAWPRTIEFIHDFSASNYALTEVTGKNAAFDWTGKPPFKFHLACESETGGGSYTLRRNLVTRDLVKLCVVQSDVKMLVYSGYPENGAGSEHRQSMLDAVVETIRRCYDGPRPGGWLLLGLLGTWPASQSVYAHTLTPAPDPPGPTPRAW
jgi:hypothetical protein